MSIVKCEVFDYVEIYVYAIVWNVKALFFVTKAQIRYQTIFKCQTQTSWYDTRGTGEAWLWPGT